MDTSPLGFQSQKLRETLDVGFKTFALRRKREFCLSHCARGGVMAQPCLFGCGYFSLAQSVRAAQPVSESLSRGVALGVAVCSSTGAGGLGCLLCHHLGLEFPVTYSLMLGILKFGVYSVLSMFMILLCIFCIFIHLPDK